MLSEMICCGRRGLHRELRCAFHVTSIAAPDMTYRLILIVQFDKVPCDLIQLFLPFAPFRASESSWTKRRFFQVILGRSSIVGLGGKAATTAFSNCLATVFG
ncbi:hypothetical protein FOTG_16254 [Fusarium oxysporum f. sp. vasinfectum 25433]|uniref:Uncharacterized protein n=1 Tax=Fusarium oxysporum f. sp. vasinfectum 25433 TaxID=1089449 RepID=X0KP91_FUSOX|nr:hypothetical protein FOTG_16254 [Fusarium oxysporum f. sp. vasinfectum 25433]